MNVYEQTHLLAQAIKESEECKQYNLIKVEAFENEAVSKMITDFQNRQLEMQSKEVMGEVSKGEMLQELQGMYTILMSDPLAAKYMQAEMRFTLMMSDVYKIIAETMGIGSGVSLKPEEE